MSAHGHFGLRSPPFETPPDPQSFYAAPSHEEALATLQYTVHAHKGCCVVLGESGSGKTLLARMLCQAVSRRTTVLWIHGIEQSGKWPVANVYAPGSFDQGVPERATNQITLPAWTRSRPADMPTPLLIVDNADELPQAAWRSIVSLLASEASGVRPPDIALFGLPSLRQVLATSGLTRLRRRVFRTYVLQPFTCEEAHEYIRHCIAAAGGEGAEIFTNQAITELHRLTRGNPGLINQVCDNAMIDAFGEDRKLIGAQDVLTAVHTIVGGQSPIEGSANALAWDGIGALALPPPRPPHYGTAAVGNHHGAARACAAETNLSESSLPPVLARATRRVFAISLETVAEAEEHGLERRLAYLEKRITDALEVVRQARLSDTNVIHTGEAPDASALTPIWNAASATQHAESPDPVPT